MENLTFLELQMANAREEIRLCQDFSGRYGLTLRESDITELVQLRKEALHATGRVEFGGGILPKLIRAFAPSPYIDQQNYAETLAGLQDAFYYFKSESMERFSDDDLIEYMQQVFNGCAQGSTELLCGISLEDLCRWARNPEAFEEDEEIV